MSDRKSLPGKFVWFEHISKNARRAQAFYRDVLGWKSRPFPEDSGYEMIFTGDTDDTMIGGYGAPGLERQPSHWISYVSVDNVDSAARAAVEHGGKVMQPPTDLAGVGRTARIADPQGAEICVFKNATGDPADTPATHGRWLWNELHTSDPAKAVDFYEKVLGFSHRAIDMGPNGTYYILSRGGVDRGGVSGQLLNGASPHWLPYVSVDDADAVLAQARKHGGAVPFGPHDIEGIGRFGVVKDPTGAVVAVMKSAPMEKPAQR